MTESPSEDASPGAELFELPPLDEPAIPTEKPRKAARPKQRTVQPREQQPRMAQPGAPIQTSYGGCRFRSRLEARWAVFFDVLGIEWEYEIEGFLVGPKRRPYLPDFWLPGERVWVEVKGSDEQLDIERLVDAAFLEHGLPSTGRMVDFHDREVRMVVLGPMLRGVQPRVREGEMLFAVKPPAWVLLCGEGEVIQTDGFFEDGGLWTDRDGPVLADASREIQWQNQGIWGSALSGFTSFPASADEDVNAAFRAAYSARFEFGEDGTNHLKPRRKES